MGSPHIPNGTHDYRGSQRGIALMAMLTLLAIWGLYLFVGQLSTTQYQAARTQNAAFALAEAKQAVIGEAISTTPISKAGYLHLPDLGTKLESGGWIPAEGEASPSFSGNSKDRSVVGKLPWKTLATPPLHDRDNDCLWYVVSGRFKVTPTTDALNWDTQGQIDIIDGTGNVIAANLAALLIAPGPALDGQNRKLTNAVYSECGGNYDARNYLDAFDSANAIGGDPNYFTNSTNNRVALDSNNKRFMMADGEHYNDRFLFITVDDIFNPLIKRKDFALAISNLLDDPDFRKYLQTVPIMGNKGTDGVICLCNKTPCEKSDPPDTFQDFCKNWKEMLFLTQLSVPTPIKIDGILSGNCRRVLLFAGRKIVGQNRSSAADKNEKLNYLENTNATSFSAPTANAENFSGAATFNWRTPEVDIVRCLL